MMGSADGSQLMRLLMHVIKARKVIEIGKLTTHIHGVWTSS